MRFLLWLLLLCACSAPSKPPEAEVEEPEAARVRFAPAVVPEKAFDSSDGEVLPDFQPTRVTNEAILIYRQFDELHLVQGTTNHTLTTKSKLQVLERLDRDHLLVDSRGVGILDVTTGRLKRLAVNQDELLSLDGDRLFFKHDLGSFVAMLEEDATSFYVLRGQEVVRLGKDGGEEIVGHCAAPTNGLPALSPDHRRLAVGLPEGRLQVYDLTTGRLVRELANIDVTLSRISGRKPTVHAGWLDDKTVRFSVSEHTNERDPEFCSDRARDTPEGYLRWHDLEVETGRETDRGRYSRLALQHAFPVPEVDRPERIFQADEIGLWLPKMIVMGVLISHDGTRAAVRVRMGAARGRSRLLLVDPQGKTTTLAEGQRIREWIWLPAVGPTDWVARDETNVTRSGGLRDRTLRFYPQQDAPEGAPSSASRTRGDESSLDPDAHTGVRGR